MGLALVIAIGMILGWLGAFVLGRDDLRGGTISILASVAGALIAVSKVGPDLLPYGVSPIELVWCGLGAALAIVLANLAADAVRHVARSLF